MPYLPTLEFVKKNGLFVRYRASGERQRLIVDIVHKKPTDLLDYCYVHLHRLKHAINRGYCGGSEFSPGAGYCEIVVAPPKCLREYHWELEVAGVAPKWMRTFVEGQMSAEAPVKSMSIVGSLPLDSSELSVTENQVMPWLEDTSTFPGMWPQVPFEVEVSSLPKGAFLRVDLAQTVTGKLLEIFIDWLADWSGIRANLPDSTETQLSPPVGGGRQARSKSAITVQWDSFDIAFGPARDSLVNGMVRFHEQVAQISRVQLEL